MRLKPHSLWLQAFMIFCAVTSINGGGDANGSGDKHTIEDGLDKPLQPEAFVNLKNKGSLSEGSITNITAGMQKLVRQNEELYKMIGKMNEKLSTLGNHEFESTSLDNRRNKMGRTKPTLCSDSCGGVIEANEFGEIIYKEGKRYFNNENCLWTVVEPDAGMISFELVTSGFEDCCDYITLNAIDQDGISIGPSFKLTSENRNVSVEGSRVNVKFSSDRSVTGTGFSLHFRMRPTQHRGCGGAIFGHRGVISYKSGLEYQNNERCVWILHSPNSNSIKLKLFEDGFESCCDYILVSTIDLETGLIRNDTKQINRAHNTHTAKESLIVIVFYSDHSARGTGFSLEFSSSGENPDPEINLVVKHFSESKGMVEYPSAEWNDGRKSNNNVYVASVSKELHNTDIVTPTVVDLKHGIFQSSKTDSCVYDSLSIYEPVNDGWKERTRFPNQTDCQDFVTVPPQDELLNFTNSFIAIFKPVSPETSGNGTRFSFVYHDQLNFDDCGGDLEPIELGLGQISYQESRAYSSNQNCTWNVQVYLAKTILFSLIKTGLEECCDTISVYSHSNPTEPPFQLTSWNRTISVAGPNATVIFSSDSSVTGYGFVLHYQKET